LQFSNYGIVILSRNFFNKNWPKVELDGLFEKEISSGRKVILPVWHKVTKEEVQQYSQILAGKYSAKTSEGLDTVVKKILGVLNIDSISSNPSNEIRLLPTKNIKSSTEIEKLIFLFSKSNKFKEAEDSAISLFELEDKFTEEDILKIADISIENDQIFSSFGARKILEGFFRKNSNIIPFEKIKKFFSN